MSKKSRFRRCLDKQYGKHAQALWKSVSQHIDDIHWSLTRKLCSKKSLVFTCQILGLRVNTLATDEKYHVVNKENLTSRIQMQFSQKKKTFSQVFPLFLKSRLNFKPFQSKNDRHRFFTFEVTDYENVVREISKKSRFRGCLDKQDGERA